MARWREARISFENSGVIRSLVEFTPNITLPPNRYYTISSLQIYHFFRIDNAFAKNYINILSLVHPIAIYTSGSGDSLTHLEMFEDPLEKEEEKTVPHHINDSEARDLLRKLCSDSNICAIQTFQRKERNSILESALRRGLGVRQLARLTGVSYGIIQRINEKVGQSPLTHLFHSLPSFCFQFVLLVEQVGVSACPRE